MAADILSSRPGYVTVLSGPAAPPITVDVDGFNDEMDFLGILTSVSYTPQVNSQFQHTLDKYVYVYVFGDRIGQMTLSGLIFAGSCGAGIADPDTGWDAINSYWLDNRVSKRGTPLYISIGATTAYYAFLVDANFVLDDPERGLGKFTLRLVVIP